ncbi:MAG TPA: M23 family metallopeptidase [Gaiellaceae bacterium]|nr:M23 family metallopeptidase [Gaiellaceae bacterium]
MSTSFTLSLGKILRIGLALVAFLLTALLYSPAARAEGPTPLFQLPFSCGQQWDASTYVGHDDLDSIDFGEWRGSPGGDNMSQGEPVLASAAGVVETVRLDDPGVAPDYGYYVVLDHGNGWKTRYAHLEQLPSLTVRQSVAQGEQIGRVGKSGGANDTYHLHYSQLADGDVVRATFDGKSAQTWGGGLVGKWGKSDAEHLTSANCAGNSFLGFDYGGSHYQLEYKPGTGAAAIDLVGSNGKGTTEVYSATWSKGWTHFMPYKVDGVPHYLAYKSATGEVDLDRLVATPFGASVTTVGETLFSKSWTHFMPFTLDGQPYFVVYNSLSGTAKTLRINPDGASMKILYTADWGKGWTHLVPFVQNGVQYFIAYASGTGSTLIDRITGSGDYVAFDVMSSAPRAAGVSQLVPVYHAGAVHLIAYSAVTGAVSFERMNANGQGTQVLGSSRWTRGWTALTPFSIGIVGYVFGYKVATGEAASLRLKADGTGITKIWTKTWSLGWA